MNHEVTLLYLLILLIFILTGLHAKLMVDMKRMEGMLEDVAIESTEQIQEVFKELGTWMKNFARTIEARITKGAKAKVQSTIEGVAKQAIGGWIDQNLGGLLGGLFGGKPPESGEE